MTGKGLSAPRGRNRCAGRCAGFGLAALMVAGCSLDGLLKSDKLPPNIADPAVTKTPEGALAAYRGLLAQFRVAFGGGVADPASAVPNSFITTTGLLTDELLQAQGADVDRRLVPEGSNDQTTDATYRLLHLVRADAGQAIGLLTTYVPGQPALASHAYALEGYAEVFLAELFCSGIPLSTVDYEGDYTYHRGSSTEEVFTHARALFDTALALGQDSLRIVRLAALGKARALLGLGDYEGAAAAVADVPDDYRYEVSYTAAAGTATTGVNFAASVANTTYSAADQEGGTGLAYRTGGDPRTTPMSVRQTYGPWIMYLSDRYAADGSTPLIVASGVEARLIEAEVALHQGNVSTWLAKLNTLRTDGTNSGTMPDSTIPDTLGVTDCGDGWPTCGGGGPGGSTPNWGQPDGGFPIPAGFSLTDSVRLTLTNGDPVQQDCYNNSWYEPCYANPSDLYTWIYLYYRPARVLWNAGTGGVAGLEPLTDPGTDSARVSLLFRERAFWLYLTGHRQGDLRRLVRQYHEPQGRIYPTGSYPPGAQFGELYGGDVTLPIPPAERTSNPLFTGCLSRGA